MQSIRFLFAAVAVLGSWTTVYGQDACDSWHQRLSQLFHGKGVCCQHCGCHSGCCKVCKLVEEEREISVTCWGISKEDFCLPGPGHIGCEHCETVCNDCEGDAKEKVESCPKKLTWRDWLPNTCADIHTKKKLMKRTETKKVKGYKWVVENLCESCRKEEKSVEIPSDSVIPQPPKIAGAVVIDPVVTQ